MDKTKFQQCRFYRGEQSCPELPGRGMLFWRAEQMYSNGLTASQESAFMEGYLDAGLAGCCDDVPSLLLATIFALYSKGSDHPVDVLAAYFTELVLPDYTQSTSK